MKTQLRFSLVVLLVLATLTGRAAQPVYDFGDAPAPFPSLLPAGARHFVTNGPIFGTTIDAELDGQPNATATGDDIAGAADENGILLPLVNIVPGVGNPIHIRVSGPTGGWVNAWIDFNRNNQWTTNEQIYRNLFLLPGLHMINLPVPAAAVPGATFARFRISTVPGIWFDGESPNGEVEDYRFVITNRQSRFFNGLQHDAETNCSLNVTPARLEVHNDGEIFAAAYVRLGQSRGFSYTYSDWNGVRGALNPVPLTFQTTYRGFVNGQSNAVAATTSIQTTPSNRLFSVNLPWIGNGSLRARVKTQSGNEVVATFANGVALGINAEAQDGGGTDNANFSTGFISENGVATSVLSASPNLLRVRLPGGTLVTGAVSVAISPVNVTSPVDYVAEATIAQTLSAPMLPDNAAGFYIIVEALPFGDVGVSGVGQAQFAMRAPQGELGISNLRTNRTDGVLMETVTVFSDNRLSGSDELAMACQPVIFTPANGNIDAFLSSRLLGLGGQDLEIFTCRRMSQSEVVNHFGVIGASNFTVTAFANGSPTGQRTVASDVDPILSGASIQLIGGAWSVAPRMFRARFTSPLTMTIAGQASLTGDEFEFSASNVPANDVARAVEVVLGDLPTVIITNIVVNRSYDFGDAPDPTFPTLLATNGARHLMNAQGLRLGLLVDAEPDGQPVNLENSVGVADDDGITLPWANIVPGLANPIHIRVSGGGGYLNAWVDFNRNGQWTTNEQIYKSTFLPAGLHMINFLAPASAVPGTAWTRFRISTRTNLWFDGAAPNGEVEDYPFTIVQRQGTNYAGLPHEAIGDASLLIESNRLKIVSLTSNSQHGVRIGLGKVEGWSGLMPVEDIFSIQFRGRLNGSNDQLVATTGLIPGQGSFGVWTDMRPLSLAPQTVQLLGSTGMVVRTLSTSNLSVLSISNPGEGIPDVYASFKTERGQNGLVYQKIEWLCLAAQNGTLTPVTVTLPNGEQVTDVKRINVLAGGEPIAAEYLSFTEVTGLDMPSAPIEELIQQNGLFHQALGAAQFQGGCTERRGDLCVTTSGAEAAGVSIDVVSAGFRPARRLNLDLQPLDLVSVANGALRVRGIGVVNGVRDSLLGDVKITQGAGGHPVEVSFGTIASTARITVLRNGERIGSVTAPVGQIGTVQGTAPITALGWATFPSSFRVTFAGQMIVAGMSGDEIVISAETAQPLTVGLQAVQMLTEAVPAWTISREITSPRAPILNLTFDAGGGNDALRFRLPAESGTTYELMFAPALTGPWNSVTSTNGQDGAVEFRRALGAGNGFHTIKAPRDIYTGLWSD
jgi:hypothetical protein